MKRKCFSKTDFFLIAAVLLIVLAFWLPSLFGNGDVTAEVTVNGETVLKLDLQKIDAPREFPLDNGVVLLAEKQSIRVLSADCPDALCVQAGALSRAGEVAVCVPNQTVVALHTADGQSDPDAITY